jgi:hypothetical protein
MATTIMCFLVFLVLLWLPCETVRFPSNNYVQTNNSANFKKRISLHTNLNAYLNHGYVSDIQHILPLNYRQTTDSQNLSRNYGQDTKENPLLNYKKAVKDDHFLNQNRTSIVLQRSLRQTASQEDSTLRSRYISDIYGKLPQSGNQVAKQLSMRLGIPEAVPNSSPSSYREAGSKYKFTSNNENPTVKHLQNDHQDLNYRQISKDMSYNSRETAVSAEERSEQAEDRRLRESDHMKMSSEEQEIMLLDVLHQKTNSTSRGFEATLAHMLGKSESVSIRSQ